MPRSRPRRRPSPPALAPETTARGGGPRTAVAPPEPGSADAAVPPAGRGRGAGAGAQAPGAAAQSAAQAAAGGCRELQSIRSPAVGSRARTARVVTELRGRRRARRFSKSPIFKEGVKGKAFYFDDTNRGILGADVGYFERTQPFSFDLWVLAPQVYEEAAVINHRENDRSGNAGYALNLEKNRLTLRRHALARRQHDPDGHRARPMPVKQWTHIAVTYDGSSRASGVGIYINGVRADVDVLSDNLTRTILTNGGGILGGRISRHAVRQALPHDDDEGRRDRRDPRVPKGTDAARGPLSARSRRCRASTATPCGRELVEVAGRPPTRAWSMRRPSSQEARDAQNQIVSVIPAGHGDGRHATPRPTYLLVRGLYSDHGDEVQP